MPAGRKSLYLQHGRPPVPPAGGWCSEAADTSNPPYAFLSGALANNTIDPYGSTPDIYSKNPQLYCIEPKCFLRFFKKTVKNVLNIDLNEEEKSASSTLSPASSNSNPFFGASTLPSNTFSTRTSPYPSSSSKKPISIVLCEVGI